MSEWKRRYDTALEQTKIAIELNDALIERNKKLKQEIQSLKAQLKEKDELINNLHKACRIYSKASCDKGLQLKDADDVIDFINHCQEFKLTPDTWEDIGNTIDYYKTKYCKE